MNEITTLQCTILGVERSSRTSVNGNPKYSVTTDKGLYSTTSDGAVNYGITNPEYQGEVILTFNGRSIVGVSTVDGTTFTGRQR